MPAAFKVAFCVRVAVALSVYVFLYVCVSVSLAVSVAVRAKLLRPHKIVSSTRLFLPKKLSE